MHKVNNKLMYKFFYCLFKVVKFWSSWY